jgi:DNA-binding IclR family transcriptional regulator
VRLFHLSESECYAVLVTLVEEGFLRESADGRYRLGRG